MNKKCECKKKFQLKFLKDEYDSMLSTQLKTYAKFNDWTYTVNFWCLNPAVVSSVNL